MNRFECPAFDTRYCMFAKLAEYLGIMETPQRKARKTRPATVDKDHDKSVAQLPNPSESAPLAFVKGA